MQKKYMLLVAVLKKTLLLQSETLAMDMRSDRYSSYMRNMTQLAENQVVRSLYIYIYIYI